MAYIGREPQIGNYQICDAISVVNAQAAYTMQVSSVNVIPESVNHMIVSLNGVIQKPGSSYTISSSTITFSSNLATGDSIDFIYLLGNVLDLGTPSDDTVTGAKIVDNAINSEHYTDGSIDTAHIADLNVTTGKIAADAITGAKIADNAINSEHYTDGSIDTAHIAADQITEAKIADNAISEEHLDVTAITGHTAETSIADGDLVLIHDASASALRKMTKANFVSGIGGTNTPAFEAYLGGSGGQALSNDTVTKVQFQTELYDTDNTYDNSSNYRFTPGVAGKYFIYASVLYDTAGNDQLGPHYIYFKKNGSYILQTLNNPGTHYYRQNFVHQTAVVTSDTDDYFEVFARVNTVSGSGQLLESDTQWTRATKFGAFKIIGA